MIFKRTSRIGRRGFLAISLAIAISTFLGCGRPGGDVSSGNLPTATIGFLLPLGTETGTQARKGGELAVQHLNDESGRAVKFAARWEDDREQAGAAGTRMEALAADSSVLGVVGPVNSGPAIAAADVANREHVVLVSPLASTPALAHPDDYFFRTWPSDAAEARFVSSFVRETLHVERVVVLNVGAPYGQDLARAFSEDFRANGGTVVDAVEYPPDTEIFGTIVSRVISRSPRAVYFVGYPPDMAEILRELRSRKVSFPVVSAAVVADPSVAQLAGRNVEGVIFPFPTTFESGASEAAMQRFVGAYKAAYGGEPGFVAAQAYDATMLIGRAVAIYRDHSHLPSREAVQNALNQTNQFRGATGVFRLDANGDAVRQYRMYEIRDGRMTPR